jgi:hypothetical protein
MWVYGIWQFIFGHITQRVYSANNDKIYIISLNPDDHEFGQITLNLPIGVRGDDMSEIYLYSSKSD